MATPAEVAALYQQLLGREADVGGLIFYGSSGKSVDQIAAELKASQEYAQRQPASSPTVTSPAISVSPAPAPVIQQTPTAPGVRDFGGGLLSIEGQGYALNGREPTKAEVLDRIAAGLDIDYGLAEKVGLGREGGKFDLAHIRSPVYAQMVDQFDPNYGTKGVRVFSEQLAKELNIDPEKLDQVAGAKFAEMLKNEKYSIYDTASMNAIAQEILNFASNQVGSVLPESVLAPVYDYTRKVHELTTVPHAKRSGVVKRGVADVADFVLDVGADILKPVGLEKYAAPIIGAGLTAALGPAGAGALSLAGAAAVGGATAGALPSVAQGDFSAGLKGAAVGGATGALGGSLAAGAGTPATFGQAVQQGATQGAITGAAGGLLTGQNVLEAGLTGGLLGGATSGLSYGIQSGYNSLTGAGNNTPAMGRQLASDLPFDLDNVDYGLASGPPSSPGINTARFNPAPNPESVSIFAPLPSTLESFNGGVGLRQPTMPLIGGMGDGTGLVYPIKDASGNIIAYQGVNGVVGANYQQALGNPNSFVNDPQNLGADVVSAGQIRNFNPSPSAGLLSPGSNNTGNGGISPIAPIANVVAGGLLNEALGGGSAASGSAGGGTGGGTGIFNPKVGFAVAPRMNKYTGDFATYGERGSGGFRFYEAPITGLLG